MSDDDRKYTNEEFAIILRKAAELTRESGSRPGPAAGLSLEEMKAIAAEAGLDPALVERAARLSRWQSERSLLGRVLGRPLNERATATFSTPVTQRTTDRVLAALRADTEQMGHGEATPSGLVWQPLWGHVSVTMSGRGGESQVRVRANRVQPLVIAGVLGGMSGVLLSPTLAYAGVAATVGIAVGAWAFFSRSASKGVDALMATINRTMTELAESPEAVEQRAQTGSEPTDVESIQ